jgi:hypothetical protein
MQIVVFKIAPRRCTSSFNVVVIFRWLPAELTTEELMLIVVFLNYPPLPSLGRCHRRLMSSFMFDVKGLDGRQSPTHDQWTNADCCILIFPPFPSLVVDVVIFDRCSFLFYIAVSDRRCRSP